ncbi:MAG: hypothetical protein PVF83_01300 [Anaerolineales bacterium]|jgi:hypothetical protein
MKEIKLISALLPSHPDLQAILIDIREKYNIPDIGHGDDSITEILLSDDEINWEEIKYKISSRIREIHELLPDSLC